jgi:predicted AAA+ superfamily ATPase
MGLLLRPKALLSRYLRQNQFILSGSSSFLTVPTLSESLAGRAVFVSLWPFSMAERTGGTSGFINEAYTRPSALIGSASRWTRNAYLDVICAGSFPEVLRASSAASRRRWFGAYIRTVISRDIRDFADVRHTQALPRLLGLVEARAGSALVLADLARSLGLPHDTVRTYLSYLETVFLISSVPAWSTNLTSRLTKTPKSFVTDSGLAAYLVRADPERLRPPGHPALGGLTETFVYTELLKLRGLTSDAFEIYHFRDRDQREIDFILETPDGQVLAIEVKSTASPAPSDARHLTWLRDKLGDKFAAGVVLHLGEHAASYGDRIFALPVSALWGYASLP